MMWHMVGWLRWELYGRDYAAWAAARRSLGLPVVHNDETDYPPAPLAEVAYDHGRWYAAPTGVIAYDPSGWHVPTFEDPLSAVAHLAGALGYDLPAMES